MSEKCQRCGEVGEDRRTLWMECFYEMNETGVPFEQVAIKGRLCAQRGAGRIRSFGSGAVHQTPIWDEPSGDERHFCFYRLRVCKDCRGAWLTAIRRWFKDTPERKACRGSMYRVED